MVRHVESGRDREGERESKRWMEVDGKADLG
jgi:hypothetical protein